jgi:ADP-heptose:LPS heptosyltransferase
MVINDLRMDHLLICRTDNIGDVVLTLPIAAYLKQHYPSLKIGFLCRGYAAPVVQYCASIDYVVALETLDDPVTWLAESGIDTIIFAKPDKRLAAAAKKARVRHRVGTSHRLFHWLYCNRLAHFSRVKSSLHEAQLNFELLRPLGFDFIPELCTIPALYRLHAPRLEKMQPQLAQYGFNLILHPKSNGNGREWPIAHYTALAQLLSRDKNIHAWITGSENEGKWIEAKAPDLLQLSNVTNMCGKLTLDELTLFIHSADGLIASGTGPLHVSAALGQTTLGLFPPVKPIHPGRWGALGVKAQNLCQEKSCHGCQDASTCRCMQDILPGQVAEIVFGWKQVITEKVE